MFKNTLLLVFSLSVLISLMIFVLVDYWKWYTGQETFSDYCLEIYRSHINQTGFWLVLGTIVGFVLGIISGFILGHLFWPQE